MATGEKRERQPDTLKASELPEAKRARQSLKPLKLDPQRHTDLEEHLVSVSTVEVNELPELLAILNDMNLTWHKMRRLRSAALLFTFISDGSRRCQEAFLALGGLVLVAEVLGCAVELLETKLTEETSEDALLLVLACLRCLHFLQVAGLSESMVKSSRPIATPCSPRRPRTAREDILSILLRFQNNRSPDLMKITALAGALRRELQAKATEERCECGRVCQVNSKHCDGCGRRRHVPQDSQSSKAKIANSSESDPQSESAMREKAVELITQGFLGAAGAREFALKLETSMYGFHGGATKEFRQHARMLKSNLALAGNSELRQRILSGSIRVEELVKMDSNALAPEALQEQRRIEQEKAIKLSISSHLSAHHRAVVGGA